MGGLPGPGLKPAGPRFAVTKFCHEPSSIIFLSASVILVHRAVSPFYRPMPYFSSENVFPTSLSLPLYAGWLA